MVDFAKVAKRIFAVRSFKGQPPEVIRERFRLITGLVRDVVDGRISEGTAKRLAREISDRLAAGGPLAAGPRIEPARIAGALRSLFGSHGAPTQHPAKFRELGETFKRFPRQAPVWVF